MDAFETELTEALQNSFHAAFVLTGSLEAAEHAVQDAIASIAGDLSSDTLSVETARSALRHTFCDVSSPVLPKELRALALLRPNCRSCFVMHVLMRLDLQTCSEILGLARCEVEDALYQSLLDLPRA